MQRQLDRWSIAAATFLSVLVSLAIAPRGMGEGDAAEFTLTLALAGVPHPPGYPLYTLLGHGFGVMGQALGLGWVQAATLWSVLAAGVATALTAALCARGLREAAGAPPRVRALLVAGPALLLAWNPVFLRAATQAEVHALHAAWVAASLLATFAWWRTPAAPGALASFGYGALLGAGLAHHPTSVCLAVPLVAVALVRAVRGPGGWLVALGAGLVLPMAAYAFVAYRALHPAAFQWPALEPGLSGVWAHVSGHVYRVYLGGFHPDAAQQQLLWRAVLPLALPGLVALGFKLRATHGGPEAAPWRAFAAAFLLQVAFTLRYGVSDPAAYFLPVLVLSVVALAHRLTGSALARGDGNLLVLAASALAVVVLFTWVVPEYSHARRVDEVDRSVRAAFAELPFERGVVLWDSDAHVRLVAHQQLEHVKPELIVLDPAMLTWPAARQRATQRLGFDPLAGRPVQSDRDLAGIAREIAERTGAPVVDFGVWWSDHASRRDPARR